ncbi:MAG: hypothetical protein ABJN96_14470 [Marinomonas sp.]
MTNQNMFYPIHYSLDKSSSQRIIIHQQDDLCITHEHLFQDGTPTRFYQNQVDTFCFIIQGEIFLQKDKQETSVKKQQGIWLDALSLSKVTLLTPKVELCFIHFNKVKNKEAKPLEKVSSGTVESESGRNHIKVWPLWQGESGSISLELYPAHYYETLYYQKVATQYILPLSGTAYIASNTKEHQACDSLGKVLLKKEPRAISNPSADSIIVLLVTTSHTKGRVLLLTKKAKNSTQD